MGVKKTTRMLSVLIAVIMIMTAAVGVFAAGAEDSPERGLITIGKVKEAKIIGQLKVVSKGTVIKYSINGGKYKTLSGSKITGLKSGNTVIVKNDLGDKSYRWMRTVKVTQKKKGAKIKWNKVKKATGYMIIITSKSGKKTTKTVGKKVTSYKVPAGSTVRVRPLRKIKGTTYMGILSLSFKVK
jgi:hypothetical protein